jgi:flagellar hook-associated protein 2
MAGLQLSGLASGFDWKSVVDQLIAIERTPQNRLVATRSSNVNKLTSFGTLRTKVGALQTAVKALSADSLIGQRKAAMVDEDSTWTATAANGSVTGEYAFNVTTLATKSQTAGATGRSANMNATNNVSGVIVSEMRLSTAVTEGIFTVNGEQITVAATDSLQDVFARIATATGNAVTATYDASTDRVSLAGTGVITLGSGADTSNFLYALRLYNNDTNTVRSASDLGTIDLDEAIASAGLATAITAVDGSGNGSFEINGTTIAYNVNTDTLQTIVSRINDSAAGVTLTYDSANDRFRLSNDNTGNLGLNVSESAGGLLNALGLTTGATTTRGNNAVFTVNGGGTIVTASNTFEASVHGLQGLTVTADSTGTQTVSVDADTAAVEAGVRAFVEKFNDVQTFIDEQTKITVGADGKVTAAQFASNREISEIARSLRGFVFDSVAGLTGTITRLENLGIDFEGATSQLAIQDEAKLTDAVSNNPTGVAALFTTPTIGFTARLDEYITRLTTTSGIIDTQETTLETQNSSLDKQIADLDRHLEAERTRLEESFIRMEQAQQKMQGQLAALQKTLNF